jgi:hypothetical protein
MKALNQVVSSLPRLALIFVIGMVAVAGASTAPAAGSPAAQLELDFDLTNGAGPCDVIDAATPVPVGATFQVGLCLTNYNDAPIGGILTSATIWVDYNGTIVNAPDVVGDGMTDLDSNPDWNQAGSTVPGGGNWDCNSLDAPASAPNGTPPPALIVCDTSNVQAATLNSPLLATLTFNAIGAGGPSPIRYTDAIQDPKPTSLLPTTTELLCGVDITCLGGQITVTGGPTVGPTPPSPTATNTPIPGVTPVSTPLPPGTEAVALVAGCSPLASTSPDGTPAQAIAGNVTPTGILSSIWKFQSGIWAGYSPQFPEVSNLTEVDFLDAVFICANSPGTFVRPIV